MRDGEPRLIRTWAIMAGLTLAAIPIGHATDARPLDGMLIVLLLTLAFVKAALLLHEYLDLRHGRGWNSGLRLSVGLLLAIVAGLSLLARGG